MTEQAGQEGGGQLLHVTYSILDTAFSYDIAKHT